MKSLLNLELMLSDQDSIHEILCCILDIHWSLLQIFSVLHAAKSSKQLKNWKSMYSTAEVTHNIAFSLRRIAVDELIFVCITS